MKIFDSLYKVFVILALSFVSASCGGDEPDPEPEVYDRVTVVYAVNRSSLASNFRDDCAEIMKAMPKVNLKKNKLILYRTDSQSQTGLYTMVRDGEMYLWKQLKSYSRTTTATDPERMAQVLRDAVDSYPASNRTLFFWGHGSAWTPGDSNHEVGNTSKADVPASYGYGGEFGKNNKTNWIDIDDLARAIPDSAFDTIWFDCCYMASVEVAYELRNKARWYVAYPTEVWEYGMDYGSVLPLTMTATPSLQLAASTFFNAYNDKKDPVTVTVMDMSRIEPLAQAVKDFYRTNPEPVSDTKGIVDYRRQSGTAYFDMAQLLKRQAADKTTPELVAVTDAMDDFVVMHLESTVDFNNRVWINPKLCGLSLHNFTDNGSEDNEYYKTLAWHKRVAQ